MGSNTPGTMGFESAGLLPFIIFGVYVALGAVAGLVIGAVGAVLWPRRAGAGK